MNVILSGLRWVLRASIFIGMLAFALNNTQEVQVHLFFGQVWQPPLVLLVLVSFVAGLLLGILGVLFSMHFSKHRTSTAKQELKVSSATSTSPAAGNSNRLSNANTAP